MTLFFSPLPSALSTGQLAETIPKPLGKWGGREGGKSQLGWLQPRVQNNWSQPSCLCLQCSQKPLCWERAGGHSCGREGPTGRGIQSPHSWFQGGQQPSIRLGDISQRSAHGRQTACTSSTEQNQSAGSPSQLILGHPPHTGQCHQQLGDCRAQMSFVSKRRDKISSYVLYIALQWILRISYSHQRCIFHPGSRSRHINPTAHNTFTVFKMCRWSMCRRRFYEQEMLEQPIVVRGQHRSCQQRL